MSAADRITVSRSKRGTTVKATGKAAQALFNAMASTSPAAGPAGPAGARMKLQVNNSGAWKNVVTFDRSHIDHAQLHADALGELAGSADSRVSFRIVDDADAVALHWNPGTGWAAWVAPAERVA